MRTSVWLIFFALSFGSVQAQAAPPPPFTAAAFRQHVAYLASDELQGRYPGTEGWAKAATYITDHFRRLKLQPLGDDGSFEQKFTAGKLPGRNLIAIFPGQGTLAEQAIIVSAHYDHLAPDLKLIAEKKGGIYNGADDDAAGTSAMMLIAQALVEGKDKLPSARRTVIFIAFDNEEQGLVGSRYYVAHPRWPLEKTTAVINLEGIGRLREGKLYAGDAQSGDRLDIRMGALAQKCGVAIEMRLGGTRRADNASFNDRRIPAFTFFTGIHADYHQFTDKVDKIDCEGGARITWLSYRVLLDLISDPQTIAFRDIEPAFDANNLIRLVQRLGLIPELDAQTGKYPKLMLVLPNSPAAKAGLRRGDEITALNGMKIGRVEDTPLIWNELELGKGLRLSILRGDEHVECTIPGEVFERLQGAIIRPIRDDVFQVTFNYHPPKPVTTVEVTIASEDRGSSKTPMVGPDKDGRYTARLEMKRAKYEYNFVIDGAMRVVDPENIYRTSSEQSSLLFVGIKP